MDTRDMNAEIFIISKEQIKSLSDRLRNSIALDSCIAELNKMLEIKSVLLWRADAAAACCGPGPSNCLYEETQMIEDVLSALDKGDVARGASILDAYAKIVP
ncbi:MAG: hypothetical protein PHV74_03075 [Dehalococcoidia bacterium]|nr:hypothetical protein [Dehalococcoidia bacterium]